MALADAPLFLRSTCVPRFPTEAEGGSARGVTIAQDAVSFNCGTFETSCAFRRHNIRTGPYNQRHIRTANCAPLCNGRSVSPGRHVTGGKCFVIGNWLFRQNIYSVFIIFGVLSWTLEDVYLADGSRQ